MKVLLINTHENSGGASIACMRLAQSLSKNGIDVQILVLHKTSISKNVFEINNGVLARFRKKFNFFWERFSIFTINGLSKKNLFKISIANTGTSLYSSKYFNDADIIHIHWINHGTLSIKGLRKLASKNKPVVWTMHDQWPFTGICHHANECKKYEFHCNNCPKLRFPHKKDISYKIFELKQSIFRNSNISLVGCSQWMSDCANSSAICSQTKITTIANPINTDVFKPEDKNTARKKMGLPLNKKIILIGACKLSDSDKGVDYFLECDRILSSQENDIMFVVFGGNSEQMTSSFKLPFFNAGYINDQAEMIQLYNSADLYLTPSLAENLPNTIMEAMACGIPCVAFDTGGISEMIEHEKNGYVSEYRNSEDLCSGIKWILYNADYANLAKNARIDVIKKYSEGFIAAKYIQLYNDLLESKTE